MDKVATLSAIITVIIAILIIIAIAVAIIIIKITLYKWQADYLAKRIAEEVKETLMDLRIGMPEEAPEGSEE